MTSQYQEIHNLKQEIKRLRLLVVENKMAHDREVRLLKQEIVKPKTDINDNPTTWGEVLRVELIIREYKKMQQLMVLLVVD